MLGTLRISVLSREAWNFIRNFEEEEGYGGEETGEKEYGDDGGCRRMVPDAFAAVGCCSSIVVPIPTPFRKGHPRCRQAHLGWSLARCLFFSLLFALSRSLSLSLFLLEPLAVFHINTQIPSRIPDAYTGATAAFHDLRSPSHFPSLFLYLSSSHSLSYSLFQIPFFVGYQPLSLPLYAWNRLIFRALYLC